MERNGSTATAIITTRKTLPAGATTEYLLDDVTLSKDADLGKITVVKKYSTNPDKTVPEEDWIPFPADEAGNPISESELSRQLKEDGKHFIICALIL